MWLDQRGIQHGDPDSCGIAALSRVLEARVTRRKNAGTSLHTLVQMVDNGLGVTMLPEMALEAGILKGTNVIARPLDSPAATRDIALIWRKNSPRENDFKLLAEELRAG